MLDKIKLNNSSYNQSVGFSGQEKSKTNDSQQAGSSKETDKDTLSLSEKAAAYLQENTSLKATVDNLRNSIVDNRKNNVQYDFSSYGKSENQGLKFLA